MRARGIDTHRLGHHHPALERTDSTSFARVEQVLGGEQGGQHEGPDQVVVIAVVDQLETEDADRRQTRQAGMAAKEFHVAKQEVKADTPGHRAERQVMAGQIEGHRAEEDGDSRGDHEAKHQGNPRRTGGKGQPGRQVTAGSQPGRRVSTEADEGRLPERGQAADAGQQHRAQRDQRRHADVVEQGDVELGQDQRSQGADGEEDSQREARADPALAGRAGRHMAVILFFDVVRGPRQVNQHRDDQREYQNIREGAGPERRE